MTWCKQKQPVEKAEAREPGHGHSACVETLPGVWGFLSGKVPAPDRPQEHGIVGTLTSGYSTTLSNSASL